jgi:hypothetical protein
MENQDQVFHLPTALGNRVAIPTFQQLRRPEEKWKAESRLPTFPRLNDDSPCRTQEAACWAHVRRKFFDLQQAHASPIAS